jgi:hypothetical protein
MKNTLTSGKDLTRGQAKFAKGLVKTVKGLEGL